MPSTAATQDGTCPVCGSKISTGDPIGYDVYGHYCEDCWGNKPDESKLKIRKCPDCWTIHEGECL